jgi:hypothetical protein
MLRRNNLRRVMAATRAPAAVVSAQRRIGEQLATWRKLRLENGEGVSLENLLRIARALGVLDTLVTGLDPYATDQGRLRSQEALPERVRPPRSGRAS